MICKLLEVRDRATFLPVMAVAANGGRNEGQAYLLRRCGFSTSDITIILTRLMGGTPSSADPYFWGDRTMQIAHLHIEENWNDLKDGDVIDVEHILGESTVKKTSERIAA